MMDGLDAPQLMQNPYSTEELPLRDIAPYWIEIGWLLRKASALRLLRG